MNAFKEIREFFWPLLEKGQPQEFERLNKNEILVDKSHLPKTLEYTLDCYNQEAERRKGIEGKASLFIGTISVVTSVVLGVTSILVKENDFDIAVSVLVFLLFVLTLYMSRTVWFSVKALERKNYYSTSIDDFFIDSVDESYYKQLIAEIANKMRKNAITINAKVDNMTMAQEYFKRAIVVVALYSFIILLFFLSKSGINFSDYTKEFILLLNQIEISGWNVLVLYILSIASIVLSLIAIRKKKS